MTVRRNANKRYGDETPDPDGSSEGSEPLLSLRTAVILMAAVMVAAVIGVLTYFTDRSVPVAVGAGLTVLGAAILPLNAIVGR